MGTYKIDLMADRLKMTLAGKFDQALTEKVVQDFLNETKKIRPSNYILEIDASTFQVLPSEMHDTLKGCFELYKSAGFKQVLMHHGDNVILSMQVKRIAKEAGLDNFEII